MDKNFKITSAKTGQKEIFNYINKLNNEVIDLSELNLFEATKMIIMISTYGVAKNSKRKFRYKVSTPNIENILKDIPINNVIELV